MNKTDKNKEGIYRSLRAILYGNCTAWGTESNVLEKTKIGYTSDVKALGSSSEQKVLWSRYTSNSRLLPTSSQGSSKARTEATPEKSGVGLCMRQRGKERSKSDFWEFKRHKLYNTIHFNPNDERK